MAVAVALLGVVVVSSLALRPAPHRRAKLAAAAAHQQPSDDDAFLERSRQTVDKCYSCYDPRAGFLCQGGPTALTGDCASTYCCMPPGLVMPAAKCGANGKGLCFSPTSNYCEGAAQKADEACGPDKMCCQTRVLGTTGPCQGTQGNGNVKQDGVCFFTREAHCEYGWYVVEGICGGGQQWTDRSCCIKGVLMFGGKND